MSTTRTLLTSLCVATLWAGGAAAQNVYDPYELWADPYLDVLRGAGTSEEHHAIAWGSRLYSLDNDLDGDPPLPERIGTDDFPGLLSLVDLICVEERYVLTADSLGRIYLTHVVEPLGDSQRNLVYEIQNFYGLLVDIAAYCDNSGLLHVITATNNGDIRDFTIDQAYGGYIVWEEQIASIPNAAHVAAAYLPLTDTPVVYIADRYGTLYEVFYSGYYGWPYTYHLRELICCQLTEVTDLAAAVIGESRVYAIAADRTPFEEKIQLFLAREDDQPLYHLPQNIGRAHAPIKAISAVGGWSSLRVGVALTNVFWELDVPEGGNTTATLLYEFDLPEVDERVPPEAFIEGFSTLRVQLNSFYYQHDDRIYAEVFDDEGSLNYGTALFLVSPDSGDVEPLLMLCDGYYCGTYNMPVEESAGAAVSDGVLQAPPGGLIFALYYPEYAENPYLYGDAEVVFDFGVMAGGHHQAPLPQIVPGVALSPDELTPPPGGKRLGTLLMQDDMPVQIPVDELIFYPTRPGELAEVLQKVNGQILMTSAIAGADPAPGPTGYLIRAGAVQNEDISRLPQTLALLGITSPLYASNTEVLKMLALVTRLSLDGHQVAVNPRIAPALAPEVVEDSTMVEPTHHTHPDYNLPRAWTELAVFDRDMDEIEVAFLDQGFSPNPDFRGYPSLEQCDLEGHTLFSGLTNFNCGPNAAVGPQTVGNSFFGGKSWHGNMVVTVAGGVINNGFGANGVAGQVMRPALYRTGLKSYAFEMGLGMQLAVYRGASVINISAGYPCRLLTKLGNAGICGTGERTAFCTGLTAALWAAQQTACSKLLLIPIIGPLAAHICHKAGFAAVNAAGTACFATLIAGDVRGEMQRGVEVAKAHGIPVVSAAGNALGSLPSPLDMLVDTSNHNADDWQIIPCTIPDVICVGSANADSQQNRHFYGPSVDIWAPSSESSQNKHQYWAPPSDTVNASALQHIRWTAGASTSAATAYISGVIALLMAANPELDPQRTSRSDLAAIPGEILAILRDTALPASGVRGPLVRPWAAVERALLGAGIDVAGFAALQYNDQFNFDEHSFELWDELTPTDEGEVFFRTGATHFIPHEIAGPWQGITSKDTDKFHFETPREWSHIFLPQERIFYRPVLRLRYPRGLGFLDFNSVVFNLAALLTGEPTSEEETREFRGGLVLSDYWGRIELAANYQSDNLYQFEFWMEKVGATQPLSSNRDRFDLDDALVNPPESRPQNDTWLSAPLLGISRSDEFGDEFTWWLATEPGYVYERYLLHIPSLTLHDPDDVDWFMLAELPENPRPECAVRLSVRVPGEDMVAPRISIYNEFGMIGNGRGSVSKIGHFEAPLYVVVQPVPGFNHEGFYDLQFSVEQSPEFCF